MYRQRVRLARALYPAKSPREGSARSGRLRLQPGQGSPGWVLGGARGPARGHRAGSSGAPGLLPRVTGVRPRGRPGSHRRSPRWVLDDDHAEDDLGEEEASSLHPSRDRAASSLGRPAPSPATALLMAQELLQYRPTVEAQEAWLNRLSELVGAAGVAARAAAPAPSRSLELSGL